MPIKQVFEKTPLLGQAFTECRACAEDVYVRSSRIAVSLPDAPAEFRVSCAGIPPGMLTVERNLFSALFHAVYELLSISSQRRHLYGRLNYLFRIWVTAADNLLDDEDKQVLDILMPGEAKVMRQVVSLMAADRVLAEILDEVVDQRTITREQAGLISRNSLQVLLPSAAEEASEEQGVRKRPDPEYVLNTIHQLKTALLFHLPLFGPEKIEARVDHDRLWLCRDGLGSFGIGCQILDDVRDMARDQLECRHNYILSLMARDRAASSRLAVLQRKGLIPDRKIFQQFEAICAPAVELAQEHMRGGLMKLDACGLGLGTVNIGQVIRFMFKALDVEEARAWLKK